MTRVVMLKKGQVLRVRHWNHNAELLESVLPKQQKSRQTNRGSTLVRDGDEIQQPDTGASGETEVLMEIPELRVTQEVTVTNPDDADMSVTIERWRSASFRRPDGGITTLVFGE